MTVPGNITSVVKDFGSKRASIFPCFPFKGKINANRIINVAFGVC